MLKLCHKCSSSLPEIKHSISNKGELLLRSDCGQNHTIYPSELTFSSFENLIHYDPNLSLRGFLVLKKNVFSINEFLKLDKNDFLKFKNCGIKTANELIKFQKALQKKLFTNSSTSNIPNILKYDNDFYEMIIEKFPSKMNNALFQNYNIDSIIKLIGLDCTDFFKYRNCGQYTINEVIRIQDIITQISNIINSHPELKFLTFKEILKKNNKIRNLMEIGIFVDHDNLPYSLNNWIFSIANHSKRNKNIFLKRFGMFGCPKMTLKQIATEYNISTSRVQQITYLMEFRGLKHSNSLRLDPIIEKAFNILELNEKCIKVEELVKQLLCCNQEGDQFKFATPFLDYLNTFPVWQKMGLSIKGKSVYLD